MQCMCMCCVFLKVAACLGFTSVREVSVCFVCCLECDVLCKKGNGPIRMSSAHLLERNSAEVKNSYFTPMV